VGGLSSDRRRLVLNNETTLGEARTAYMAAGNPNMNQDVISDENYFKFSDAELNRPLTDFSNGMLWNFVYK